MNKRKVNVIDNLIKKNTDHSKLVLNMTCIFFNVFSNLFGHDCAKILNEFLVDNDKTVDEIVYNCSISHSGYYRKIKQIYVVIAKLEELVNKTFIKIEIDNCFINDILNGYSN